MEEFYVARDRNGKLFFYNKKPYRTDYSWSDFTGDFIRLPDDLFPEVKWEDAEPAKISLAITKTDDKDEFYVVKNADNSLYLWHYKPVKRGEEWCFGNHDKLTFLYYGNIPIPEHLFPEVRWEDEHPTKVKLTLL